MRRGDATVIAVTVALAVVVAAAVTYSLRAERTATSSSSLLVLTWAPSLCKVDPANSGCKSGHVGSVGRAFILHGLWPQPSTEVFCGVPERAADRDRQPVSLPAGLQADLKRMMSDSAIQTTREWYKHGTCSGLTPPDYFGIAVALADQAVTVLDPVFANAADQRVSSRSVRAAFDTRFGEGAGERVRLKCRPAGGGDRFMYEVHLSLPSAVRLHQESSGLGDAIADGPTVPPGCGEVQVP